MWIIFINMKSYQFPVAFNPKKNSLNIYTVVTITCMWHFLSNSMSINESIIVCWMLLSNQIFKPESHKVEWVEVIVGVGMGC